MASSKKQDQMEVAVKRSDALEGFDLQVDLVAGKLSSNARELRLAVERELENYNVERYIGDPSAAKKDKATLNKAADAIKSQRIRITEEWNKPLEEFYGEMKAIEASVNDGYSKLNAIVKEAESKEKEEKLSELKKHFDTLGFDLVPFERVLETKWLNKGESLKKVLSAIDLKVNRIKTEFKLVTDYARSKDLEPVVLQSIYMDKLDLEPAMREAERLVELKAQVGAREAEETKAMAVAEEDKAKAAPKVGPVPEETAPESIPSESEEVMSFNLKFRGRTDIELFLEYCAANRISTETVVSVSGSKAQLYGLRCYVDAKGIYYEKV